MAIVIEIINGDIIEMELADAAPIEVTVNNDTTTLTPEVPVTTMVEVQTGPQGPPGVQNVFVGPQPPANPQQYTIWIDTT